MHDAILFERFGIPAVGLVTHVFTNTGRAMADLMGIPDFPFVVVDHPLSSLTRSEIRSRAIAAAPAVRKLLTTGTR